MPKPASLNGITVLVLEDDFFIAEDAREALEEAGATVLGPFGGSEEALLEAERGSPDCALVDLNLGRGPSFEPAQRLLQLGIPIVLVTGYDHDVIPPILATAPCLQKPTQPYKMVAAVGGICGR